MENYIKEYAKWLKFENLDDELKAELIAIKDDEEAIKDRFYKNLAFGTGGLRGLLGAGINRMNIYTVRRATQGLVEYIKKYSKAEEDSVVIAYDSRIKSRLFAQETAQVLAENNIKAWIFKEITPTPVLSFAVRELKCSAGVVITASHNPKEYNGYKVYWSDGGQITDTIANGILAEIVKIKDSLDICCSDFSVGLKKGLIGYVPQWVLDNYLSKVSGLLLQPETFKSMREELSIVYTPLHGTGYIPVKRALEENGFKNLHFVPQQVTPDGTFPTVKYPNPEDHGALEMALNLGTKVDAELVMATDPDADRLGIAVKDKENNYQMLTGNQIGALLLDYILTIKSQKGLLNKNEVLVKTIVTSQLGKKIAEKHQLETIDVLTGFKYIGEKIKEFEEKGKQKFLFGYEESYGYLIGDFVRDKDAVQACLLCCEMAAYYKSISKDLYLRLQELYEEYGYFQEDLVSFNFQGVAGQEKIVKIMDFFRNNYPTTIGTRKVTLVADYYKGKEKNIVTGLEKVITLPKANVIHITLEDGSWVCVRPSGTEPKLKIYLAVTSPYQETSAKKILELRAILTGLIDGVE